MAPEPYRIRKNNLVGSEAGIEQSDPFSSDFPHGSQVSTQNLTKIN
jgi:hypothetical protein